MNELKVEEFEDRSEEQRLPSRVNVHKRKRSKTTKKKPLFFAANLVCLIF